MKVVVIGAGAAGMMFATQYKKMNKEAKVTVLEKSNFVSWAGCPSPYYIADLLPEKKVTGMSKETFIEKGIDLRTNTAAQSINFDEKFVQIENEKIYYDKLVLALGAKANLSINKEKYFNLSHAQDALDIKKYLNENKVKNALVVGCGFIGLEMVEAFLELGINVSVVEKQENIFLSLPEFARTMIIEKMKEKNVKLIVNNGVKEFNEDNVILEDNTNIDFDICLLSVGIRPNVDILGDKIELFNRMIKVDSNFETNIKDVYAIGDCTLNNNYITNEYEYAPFGDVANKHGMMLAKILSNKINDFIGVGSSSTTSFFDLKVAKTGLTFEQAKQKGFNPEVVKMDVHSKNSGFKDAKPGIAEIIYDKDKKIVLGACICGYEAIAQFIDQIAIVIRFKIDIKDFISIDFAYSPTNASVWNPLLVLYRKVIK